MLIPTYDSLVAALRVEAAEYLSPKLLDLRDRGVDNLRAETLEGPAADKIIDLARATPGSLIAISTHGRSGVRRWMLGSVTENVVRHATSPVLILRAAV
jgi:nucleotide-binding universal stress UspA family protein